MSKYRFVLLLRSHFCPNSYFNILLVIFSGLKEHQCFLQIRCKETIQSISIYNLLKFNKLNNYCWSFTNCSRNIIKIQGRASPFTILLRFCNLRNGKLQIPIINSRLCIFKKHLTFITLAYWNWNRMMPNLPKFDWGVSEEIFAPGETSGCTPGTTKGPGKFSGATNPKLFVCDVIPGTLGFHGWCLFK